MKCLHCKVGDVKETGKKYCSLSCFNHSRFGNRSTIRLCQKCGSEFMAPNAEVRKGGAIYCSRECYLKKPPYYTCRICNKDKPTSEFPVVGKKKPHRSSWCQPCHVKRYRDYLRTPKHRFSSGKSRAKRTGVPWTLTPEQYWPMLDLPCHYCGGPLGETAVGLDQKVAGNGYTPDNVVSCCGRCNWVKGDVFTYEEMMRLAPTIRLIDQDRKNQEACLELLDTERDKPFEEIQLTLVA